METPEIDKRLVKAIVEAVNYEKAYAIRLNKLASIIKGLGKTEEDGYKLFSGLYSALNEGRLKYTYLIKVNDSIERAGILIISPEELINKPPDILLVSPVELTNEQLETLDVLVRWVKALVTVCACRIRTELLVQRLTNALITLWSGEEYDKGLYKFAINNGITSESELAELGIKVPSLANPNKTKRGDGYD
jgi:hypothetical protein